MVYNFVTPSHVVVRLPNDPYPSQRSVMCRVTRALKESKNCLIESPTGTGKTLALLCSTLAWKEQQKNIVKKLGCNEAQNTLIASAYDSAVVNDDDLTDKLTEADNLRKMNELIQVPRIYYGTRTHKQIAQLVTELRKTDYAVTHTILCSKDHTCIHPEIATLTNRNEACAKLVNSNMEGCKYYNEVKQRFNGHASPVRCAMKLSAAQTTMQLCWDIEDLLKFGRREKLCPYYLSNRVLMRDAEIVFCPYNYLIDPLIRKKMDIDLEGQVVIIDEAHNIENACREVGGKTISLRELKLCRAELSQLVNPDNILQGANCSTIFGDVVYQGEQWKMAYTELKSKVSSLMRWLEESAFCRQKMGSELASDGTHTGIWSGKETEKMFATIGWTTLIAVHKDVQLLDEIMQSDIDMNMPPNPAGRPSRSTLDTLEKLFHVGVCFFTGVETVNDYKMVIKNKITTRTTNEASSAKPPPTKRAKPWSNQSYEISLNFHCLNPAVIFRTSFEKTRSVILASGTLCPIDSLSSELATVFHPITLEAHHVIPKEQFLAVALKTGPNSNPLRATYQNYLNDHFQDELGRLVLSVANMVPGGILVFLPSYIILDNLLKRWEESYCLGTLRSMKTVACENRSPETTETEIQKFYAACQIDPSSNDKQTGAIFFAVYRGKVSEGMDFSDEKARAVITVGIPYANVKDTQIDLKRKYNDQYGVAKGMLPGREWYEVQAFRALNQALGRCIRHKDDWGVIIVVDERFFQKEEYISGISKWLRTRMVKYSSYIEFTRSLKEFIDRMK